MAFLERVVQKEWHEWSSEEWEGADVELYRGGGEEGWEPPGIRNINRKSPIVKIHLKNQIDIQPGGQGGWSRLGRERRDERNLALKK